jgi:Meiotically Up-regulated Gene 113 (MUG113) protein
MSKICPRTGIPILTRREMRKLGFNELVEYHFRVLHAHKRCDALQTALEQSALIMFEKQQKLRDAELEPRTERYARPGYIYLVGGNDVYKIGKSKDVPSRLRSFLQLPFKTRLIHAIPTSDMVWAETYLHRTFAHCRLNGEWFDLAPHEVEWICGLTALNPDR